MASSITSSTSTASSPGSANRKVSIQDLLKHIKKLFELGILYERARAAGNDAEAEKWKRIADRMFEEVDKYYQGK